MLMEQTLEKMNQMKLSAMVAALDQQRISNQYTDLSFEERLGLLIDEEWTALGAPQAHPAPARGQAALHDRIAGKRRLQTSSQSGPFPSPRPGLGRMGPGPAQSSSLSVQQASERASWLRPSSNVLAGRACNATYVRMPRLLHTTGGRPWRRLLHPSSGPVWPKPICWPSTTGSWLRYATPNAGT